MHISEGVLSAPILISGMAMAVAGTAIGIRRLDTDRIAQTGMLAASFFVASLIHVPAGFSSVHLVMNGLLGILLGWAAFPAILVALILQAVFFQFGGFTTLGVNTFIMAAPAVICHYLFRNFVCKETVISSVAAFGCGALSIFLSGVIVGLSLYFTEKSFWSVVAAILAANVPVMIIEGIITVFCISFLKKVQPAMFGAASVHT